MNYGLGWEKKTSVVSEFQDLFVLCSNVEGAFFNMRE